MFQRLSNDDKWRTAKQLALCFRCLEDNHRGKSCPRSKQCNINGCRGTHHNLLHYNRMPSVPGHSNPRPEAEPYVNRPITPLQTASVASERPGVSMEGNSTQRLVTMETYGNVWRVRATTSSGASNHPDCLEEWKEKTPSKLSVIRRERYDLR